MFLRKRKKLISRVLLIVLLLEALTPFIASTAEAGSPVSDKLNGLVDPFTGDFHYNIPLFEVPGPNGESVPVTLSYSAGIQVEQEASWVGLGWNLEAGEITRQVNGVADDWNGEHSSINQKDDPSVEDYLSANFYGPLYFQNYTVNALSAMDLYQSSRFLGSHKYDFPDYDTYNVSGPGIGGAMSLHLFDYKQLFHNMNSNNDYFQIDQYADYSAIPHFSQKAQFVFKDETAPVVTSTVPLNTASNLYKKPEEISSSCISTNCIFGGNYIPAKNRPQSGNYVEYFTNAELNVSDSNLPSGFLDYAVPSGQRRNSATFPQNGIGAFRVTNTSGMTYHYSLPVYSYGEKGVSFPLDENFNPDLTKAPQTSTRNSKYASSWKLTAITGTDYVDANNNHIVDQGDQGYWVSYNYGRWTDNFNWRTPFFGYDNDILGSIIPYYVNNYQNLYQRKGAVNSGSNEVYYLNSIQTATHTAYFIKEVRYDAHSKVYNTNGDHTPKLRLNKIVLLRNEDIGSLLATNNTDPLPLNNFASLGNGHPENVVHIGNYNAHKSAIDPLTLKTIEFTQDYSLCSQVYNNINNTFTTSSVQYTSSSWNISLYDYPTSSAYASSNSGKLTLKSVKTLEKGYVQLFPAYNFDYSRSYLSWNKDKKDLWGFYKYDYDGAARGAYTTEQSKDLVDTWSLNSITTPEGAVIHIDYESDQYNKVGYTGDGTNLGDPQRVFLIKKDTVDYSVPASPSHVITMYDKETFSFITSNLNKLTFIIPYRSLVCNQSSCTNVYSTKTFTYGGNYPPQPADFTLSQSILQFSGVPMTVANCTCGNELPVVNSSSYDPSWALGYALVNPLVAYGGGLRVKDITINEAESGHVYKNAYTYSGGIATVEPDRFAILDPTTLAQAFSNQERHVLPPSVGYSSVSVQLVGDNQSNIGRTEYNFFNYQETYVPIIGGVTSQYVLTVNENNALYGTMRSIKMYDSNNVVVASDSKVFSDNSNPLTGQTSEVFYNSTAGITSLTIKNQLKPVLLKQMILRDGITVVHENKTFDPYTGTPTLSHVTDPASTPSDMQEVPAYTMYSSMGSRLNNDANKNILSSTYKTTVLNYINRDASNNVVTVPQTHIGDGQLQSWTNTLLFRRYNAPTGKYTNDGVFGSPYWFPSYKKVYNGDANENNWKVLGGVTLVDIKNKRILEQKDIVRFSAAKYGYNNQYKVSEAGNCNYVSYGCSSFEDTVVVQNAPQTVHFSGEISGGQFRFSPNPATVVPHSGSYVLNLQPSQSGGSFYSEVNTSVVNAFQTGRTYHASVWVHTTSSAGAQLVAQLSAINGSGTTVTNYVRQKDDPQNVKVGNWILMSLDIDVPSAINTGSSLVVYLNNPSSYAPTLPGGQTLPSVNNTLNAFFDDFRIQPVDATVTEYVRDPKTGWVTAVLDNENFATYYTLDAAGRIVQVDKETATFNGTKKVSTNVYHTR